jgi:DNA-binding NtrC family response regulator/tetratricopeptide (TPR) repeat protein
VNALEIVEQLNDEGRFADALKALNDQACVGAARNSRDVLRAELLERVGRFGQARSILKTAMKAKELTGRDRSSCEFILGKIDLEEGLTESAIAHLQHSVQLARESGDLRRQCWPSMLLLVTLCDRSGPDAVASILNELRHNAIRLGEPRILAALHSFTGQMDAKRGLLNSALWHVKRSQQILASAPNAWIEAQIEFTKTNIAVLQADYRSALRNGRHAVELAERSGGAACRRTCLGNLGFVFYLLGQFDEAVAYLEGAIAILPSAGENHNALVDTLARIRLAQGRMNDCRVLLDKIEEGIQVPGDRMVYPHRHATLTRASLLAREGHIEDAINQADRTLSLAEEAKDLFLWQRGLLTKARFLQLAGRDVESMALLDRALPDLILQSPDLHAQYEMILACAQASAGLVDIAIAHRTRAERLFATLHHTPGLLDLSRDWDAVARSVPTTFSTMTAATATTLNTGTTLQAVATLMAQTNRPEFLAHELIGILDRADCVRRAAALLVGENGEPEVMATIRSSNATDGLRNAADSWPRRFVIGPVRDRTAELWLEPREDIESIATVNAVALLLSTVRRIERERAEREQRLTLWPIDDTLLKDGQAILTGRMLDVMTMAKRIATTHVSVLITGESGTGKEILARAIHNYSDRSDKPFIPFNCAAIPREMLESQLFGHRRGAFTGAERDNPGIIRATRGGTLFLDEIGELNLELQPKLLRFLESGEICPLGESIPFTVDVRVLAATNSNLETAVKIGRFREDLFYRLNVVRLEIPPLRERRDEIPGLVHRFVSDAAAEFRKGFVQIAHDAMEQLVLFPWPGNIRQLQNEIRRIVALAEPNAVLASDNLSVEVASTSPVLSQNFLAVTNASNTNASGEKLRAVLERIECEMIKLALRDHQGRVDHAAKALGISRKGLYLKRQRLGL